MMHCSYLSNQSTTSNKVCIKHDTEARFEGLETGTSLSWLLKKNFPICRNCPIKKRLPSFESVN
jgi:hypothetical protein